MPYGVDKDMGGDSPENDAWMEKCVKRVHGKKMKDGSIADKSTAIAICKSVMRKTKGDKAKASFILDKDLIEEYFHLVR